MRDRLRKGFFLFTIPRDDFFPRGFYSAISDRSADDRKRLTRPGVRSEGMNVRGAAGGGGGGGDGVESPTDGGGFSAAMLDVGRKMLAMDGLRPAFRTGPSPVAHNGRYWTPDRRHEDAETTRYIRRLVQACETIRPWTAGNRVRRTSPETSPRPSRASVTMDQLPRVMQKVRARWKPVTIAHTHDVVPLT